MKVTLLTHTPNPLMVTYIAARMCYSPLTGLEIFDKVLNDEVSQEQMAKLVQQIVSTNHNSVLRHVNFTFIIDQVSRYETHEHVRHTAGVGISQQSTRYALGDELNADEQFVLPPGLSENAIKELKEYFEIVELNYNELAEKVNSGELEIDPLAYGPDPKKKVKNEALRYMIPGAIRSNLMFTGNAQTLLNFFDVRCCERASWEIKEVADKMLKLVKPAFPEVFKRAGAFCVHNGYCNQGERTCGKFPTLIDLKKAWANNRG